MVEISQRNRFIVHPFAIFFQTKRHLLLSDSVVLPGTEAPVKFFVTSLEEMQYIF